MTSRILWDSASFSTLLPRRRPYLHSGGLCGLWSGARTARCPHAVITKATRWLVQYRHLVGSDANIGDSHETPSNILPILHSTHQGSARMPNATFTGLFQGHIVAPASGQCDPHIRLPVAATLSSIVPKIWTRVQVPFACLFKPAPVTCAHRRYNGIAEADAQASWPALCSVNVQLSDRLTTQG